MPKTTKKRSTKQPVRVRKVAIQKALKDLVSQQRHHQRRVDELQKRINNLENDLDELGEEIDEAEVFDVVVDYLENDYNIDTQDPKVAKTIREFVTKLANIV